MSDWQRLPATSQLAAHLRGELERGRWSGRMPGVIRLARELGAARTTVEVALKALEREGLLAPQGQGRGRLIASAAARSTGLRVGILLHEASDLSVPYMIDLQHRLAGKGNTVVIAPKTLLELGQNVERVARMAEGMAVDAWVVEAGSQSVLQWFAAQKTPAFALFGRRREIPIAGAGPDKGPVMREVVRRLVSLGHRRIVLFVRAERRHPAPGRLERAFLEELAAQGISTGTYHLPEWEETPEGLVSSLDRLLGVTPPTCLIFDEGFAFAAAQQHLAQRGILAPRDVSLVCCDPPPSALSWMRPSMAHIRWDHRSLVRRILRWLSTDVAEGRRGLRQSDIRAEFVEGGTVGASQAADKK